MMSTNLNGKVIAITRPEEQANESAKLITELGGIPYIIPTIKLVHVKNPSEILHFLQKVCNGEENLDFLIFLSKNGVKYLIHYLNQIKLRTTFIDRIKNLNVIAIGPKTRFELENNKINVKLMPEKYSSKGIIELFRDINVKNKYVVILCSNVLDNYLKNEIRNLGGIIKKVILYDIQPQHDFSKFSEFLKDLINGKIDAITFTCSAGVVGFFKLSKNYISFRKLKKILNKITISTIGPETQKTLRKFKVKTDVVPKLFTFEHLIESLNDYFFHVKS